MTNPDTLAAIEAAEAHVGKLPRKWLVCSWQMYREIRDHYERKETEERAFFTPPEPPGPGINIYGAPGTVQINVHKGWDGRRWKLCTKAERDWILDEHLRGHRSEHTWDELEHRHACCGARSWYRHLSRCPRVRDPLKDAC